VPTRTGPAATAVDGDCVVFWLPDPHREFGEVRLAYHLDLGPRSVEFEPVAGGWQLRWALPPVDRIEYQFLATRAEMPGEHPAYLLDPGNPVQAPGPFGPKSVVELPGYHPPAWLADPPIPSHRVQLTLTGTPVGTVDALLWSPADTAGDQPLPVLVVHDGPEMDEYAQLTSFVGAMIAQRRLPPMRVLLVAPGPRNLRYSANPRYALALTEHVLPPLLEARPTNHPPVIAGASLGGLAALHAEWSRPGTFGGLFLQSGSFFTRRTDAQESGFEFWNEVTGFVARVHASRRARTTAAVTITTGTAEENRANNELMAAQLGRLGLPVALGRIRDGHTFTGWRDAFDPHLVDLLTRVWA
jgi:enterochelin esterase family protein